MKLNRNMWAWRLKGIKSNVSNAKSKFHKLLSDNERKELTHIENQLNTLITNLNLKD